MLPVAYVVGIGSNLGDRLGNLIAATRALAAAGTIDALSSLYETEAIGPPQPDFLNGAILLGAELEPEALLELVLDIEHRLGRVRRERWGPRHIDLDLLWAPAQTVSNSRLHLPHRELQHRAFALAPLLDVAPDARDPLTLELYRDALARLPRGGIARVPGSELGAWFA